MKRFNQQKEIPVCFVNSVDPDEMVHDEPSHQTLRCLPFCYDFLTETLFGTMFLARFKDGRIHIKNSGMKGLKNDKVWSTILLSFLLNTRKGPAQARVLYYFDSSNRLKSEKKKKKIRRLFCIII